MKASVQRAASKTPFAKKKLFLRGDFTNFISKSEQTHRRTQTPTHMDKSTDRKLKDCKTVKTQKA